MILVLSFILLSLFYRYVSGLGDTHGLYLLSKTFFTLTLTWLATAHLSGLSLADSAPLCNLSWPHITWIRGPSCGFSRVFSLIYISYYKDLFACLWLLINFKLLLGWELIFFFDNTGVAKHSSVFMNQWIEYRLITWVTLTVLENIHRTHYFPRNQEVNVIH